MPNAPIYAAILKKLPALSIGLSIKSGTMKHAVAHSVQHATSNMYFLLLTLFSAGNSLLSENREIEMSLNR